MYKVLVDDKVLCDSRIDDLAIINPVVELAVNTVDQFSFTIPPTHPLQDLIKIRTSIITVYRDNELAFRGVAVSESVDFYRQKTYECEGVLTFLNDSIQRPAHYSGLTVLELLTSYIANHNQQVDDWKKFQIGKVTVTDPNNYISCYTNMSSTMTEIKEDLIDDLGGFLRTRYENGINYIDYLAESPHDATQVIELGKNLLDYKSNLSSMTIATRVIPLGEQLEEQVIEGLDTRLTIESVNGGIDYIESSLVDTYGIISAAVIFDNVTTAGALMTKGTKYLSDIQFENVTIEATAIDFGYLSSNIQKFKLLDKVHIISSAHGMDRWFLLSEMTLNLNNPENDRFKFGMDGIKSLTAQTKTANDSLLKAIEKITPESDLLKMAKEQATALISGTDGGYVVINVNDDGVPYEILIMDKPTKEQATKVWRWNQNGLGYSNTGYNGPYGLAITMYGKIVADFIAAGTMYADRIKGGTLTLGGINNDNGILRILNSKNEEVGRWDKDGITLPDNTRLLASQIFGGVLTLGGKDNEKALMQILDAEDNQIGKWDKDGIAANKGDIAGWILDSQALYKNSNVIGTRDAKYLGENGLSVSNYFMVNNNGLFAKNINYEGDIYSYGIDINNYPGKTVSEYKEIILKIRKIDMTQHLYVISIGGFTSSGGQVDAQVFLGGTSNTHTIEYDEYYDEYIVTFDVAKLKNYASIEDDSRLASAVLFLWEDGATKGVTNGESIKEAKVIYNDLSVDVFDGIVTDKSNGILIDMEKNKIEGDSFRLIPEALHIFKEFALVAHEDWQMEHEEVMRLDRSKFMHKGIANASATSSGTDLRIDSDGTVHKYSSSSKRYKDDITGELSQQLDPHKLYDINVVQFKYKDDYLKKDDLRCRKDIIGFLAEDIAEKYPIACSYKDGVPEMWEVNILFPALLKLVQEQNERIKKLEEVLLDGRH